jgi:HPt (histidine-containing phosphotransfer) domain-containing protein
MSTFHVEIAHGHSEERLPCQNGGMDDVASPQILPAELTHGQGSDSTPVHPLRTEIQAMDPRSQSPAAAEQAELIDTAAWNDLRYLFGSEPDAVLCELIDAYLEEASRLLSSIVMAHQNQATQAMITACHALRSPSASLGALRLASLCGQVEESCRSILRQWPPNLVDQILVEAEWVFDALRNRRSIMTAAS